VGGAAPPTKSEDEIKADTIKAEPEDEATIIEEGRQAFERRKTEVRASWEDWVLFGKALRVGREKAKQQAGGKTKGNKYSTAFHLWLKDHGFLDIDKVMDKDDRAKLLWLIDRLPEVEALRESWSKAERAQRNHPYTIYMVAHCKSRGLPEFRDEESGEPSNKSNGNGATCRRDQDHDQDEEHQKKNGKLQTKRGWDPGQLMLAANKAMGLVTDLKLKGGWPSPEPPYRSLVMVWWELAWPSPQGKDNCPPNTGG
jgi:hypothetical protein